jgi:FMN phosphatase YigB (HAD superfamily)
MKNKVILTDCDGVILDWEYSFTEWMRGRGYTLAENYHTMYNIGERYNISKEEGRVLVSTFNESANIGYLPPLRDAVKYIRKIHEKFGYVFHIITSLSTDPYAYKLRKQNLEALLGQTFCEKLICLETGADKDVALEPYRDSGCLWVEDKPENAVLGTRLGLESILIRHPFNEDFNDSSIIPVHSWKEIYRQLKQKAA